jgi:hypothetical protein
MIPGDVILIPDDDASFACHLWIIVPQIITLGAFFMCTLYSISCCANLPITIVSLLYYYQRYLFP